MISTFKRYYGRGLVRKMYNAAINLCHECGRKDRIPFSKEDVEEAIIYGGGLVVKTIDHDDHVVIVHIDTYGIVRRQVAFEKVKPIAVVTV